MDQKLTRRAALGLVVGGAALTASETLGYSRITAGRGTSISAADDPNALLGIEGKSDTSVKPTFTNNSSRSMDVTLDSADDVEFDVGDNGNWVAPPVTFSLAVDESKKVNMRFAGECTASGAATVDIDAVLEDSSGSTVGSIDLTRDFEIPEAGQASFTGSVNSSGSSGKYEFDIENTGCIDVTFKGIGINETTTTAEFVTGGGSLFNLTDGGTEVVSDRIPIDSSDPTSDTRRDMDPDVPLAQGDTVTFEFRKFAEPGPGNSVQNVDMRGEDVRITLYFGDGSSATIKLCMGSCDF